MWAGLEDLESLQIPTTVKTNNPLNKGTTINNVQAMSFES